MNDNHIKSRITTSFFLLLLIPCAVNARGNVEHSGEYELELSRQYKPILEKVASYQMDPEKAKAELHQLRTRYNRDFDDISGILDSLIDAVFEGRMSLEDASEQFRLLLQKRIDEQNRQTDPAERNDQNGGHGQNGGGAGTGGNGPSSGKGGR